MMSGRVSTDAAPRGWSSFLPVKTRAELSAYMIQHRQGGWCQEPALTYPSRSSRTEVCSCGLNPPISNMLRRCTGCVVVEGEGGSVQVLQSAVPRLGRPLLVPARSKQAQTSSCSRTPRTTDWSTTTIRTHETIAWNRPREAHLGLADPTAPTFQA